MTEAENKPETEKKDNDALFVKSKIKAYCKSKDMNSSDDVINGEVLQLRIQEILDKGITRAKLNGKKTLQERDL
jgi:hypothetical protein